MSPSSPAAVAAVGLLLASASCTSASDVEPYVQPTPAALSVVVGSARDAAPDGTVPRNERFVVQLDGYPDPDSVGFGPLQLRSGAVSFDIDVSVNLVDQQILVTPRSLMNPGVQYDLVVSGLVTLDDRVQGPDVVGSFRIGADTGDPFPAPPRPTWTADVEPILGVCAPSCHSTIGARGAGDTRTPTRLLDLTPPADPRDPVFGLIDVQSVGLRGTPTPLLRVSPYDPARSVLLRKLIGGDPQADSQDPPYPNMRVDGRRMPINLDESSHDPVPVEQLRTIQDWIAAGAPID